MSRARAQARLHAADEREEALASAAEEHEENEELLAAIRDLLRLAPARVRDRSSWLPGLERRPFPAAQRELADRDRLESQVRQAPGTFAAEGLEEIDAEFARVVRALETISGRTPS